jgi:hypothetical protein
VDASQGGGGRQVGSPVDRRQRSEAPPGPGRTPDEFTVVTTSRVNRSQRQPRETAMSPTQDKQARPCLLFGSHRGVMAAPAFSVPSRSTRDGGRSAEGVASIVAVMTGSPQIGASARRTRTVTRHDIELFTEMTGDCNPIHYDDEARTGQPVRRDRCARGRHQPGRYRGDRRYRSRVARPRRGRVRLRGSRWEGRGKTLRLASSQHNTQRRGTGTIKWRIDDYYH